MKTYLIAAAILTLAGSALAADVGVSVSIGQPGFYGRIVLGNAPQPQVIYAEPVIIQQVPVGAYRQPIYLRVPPGHERNWNRYCRQYNACGQPVYFVQNTWYRDVYAPHYRGDHGDRGDRGDRRDRGDRWDERGDGNRGDNGHGHGHGHDKWKKGRGND
jgi:hypothetical protein